MAMFVLTKRAKEYFDKLNLHSTTGSIARDLEQWWLCAQIGLLIGIPGPAPEPGSPDMVDYFIKSLEPSQARIRGLLIMRHLQRVDAGGMKREILETEMGVLLGMTNSRLTDAGIIQLNRYATNGFQRILEEIGPQTELFVFMLEYHRLVNILAPKAIPEDQKQSTALVVETSH